MTLALEHPNAKQSASIDYRPIVWTIAGSDSCGGAGIQADQKTFQALDVHGCTVISALTAQSPSRVDLSEPVSKQMLNSQLRILSESMSPSVVKTGMLWSAEHLSTIASAVGNLEAALIVDPVMVSTSGFELCQPDYTETFVRELIPRADVLTPNIAEAHVLLGRKPTDLIAAEADDLYLEELATALLELGPKSVLLKGGHRAGKYAQDFWTDGTNQFWLTGEFLGNSESDSFKSLHGTGCTLSAALAAFLANGYSLADSLVLAKAYVSQSIRRATPAGSGTTSSEFLLHSSHPENGRDMPRVTSTAQSGRDHLNFPELDFKIGFYPIVDSHASLLEVIAAGISAAQLRIKNQFGNALDKEIEQSITVAKQNNCRLFINDHWECAIRHEAYGVHLGQEDLRSADLHAIRKSGLRLGISTHCYEEVARAIAWGPSYLAIGPIFPTTTKKMSFAPQGLNALARWRRTLSEPLVAIGGIFLDNARDVLSTGVDSIAVVRDISTATDRLSRARQWVDLFRERDNAN